MFIVGLPSNAILLYFLYTAKVSVVADEEDDDASMIVKMKWEG